MRGLAYRAAMAVVAVVALVLVFWQAGWLGAPLFAAGELALLCACAVYTLLILPPIIRPLAAPASIGAGFATVLFDAACVVIACLQNGDFWTPVIIAIAVYALLLLTILFMFARQRD
ncbi:MAG: hypothetical protein LBK98_08365 [Peptococcaceae bacterium]|jgi:hypothetical protein|nr:hypothetical protein [Peptococcaceae bacterium]